ncbi:uncharacterized protein LOC131629164 [Vicia villosa]|uniref:uncharacterized protein LOC131629164 n=1 Tax=Vicia villosa TaxID=3911 RepID=UPI00273C7841|nr:uncharacterized protein LOC131629164 [Vicia villosa]
MIGDRDISDHCPIWIMLDNKNWGPKPFKFNNEWFSSEAFIPFVEKEWNSLDVQSRGDFILKDKLRLFKEIPKRWNKEVFGKIDLEVEDVVHDINVVDERLDFKSFPSFFDDDVIRRKEASCCFWKNLRIKENMLLQRSRLNWLKEGDSNSGFFHKVMKQRRRSNHIGPILSSRGLVETVEDVREDVFSHFERKFTDPYGIRPLLDGVPFKAINGEEAEELEELFLEAEIKKAVWECGGSKSQGPDGYSFLFFKKCWHSIKEDVINFFNHFFTGGSIAKGITSSFFTLIPKSKNPIGLDGQLLDGVVVANEVVDFARKEGCNCILFKVDFEKAYDNVGWSFLRYMLQRMVFGEKWKRWMELLVFSCNISVLVNGSPTKEFKVGREKFPLLGNSNRFQSEEGSFLESSSPKNEKSLGRMDESFSKFGRLYHSSQIRS